MSDSDLQEQFNSELKKVSEPKDRQSISSEKPLKRRKTLEHEISIQPNGASTEIWREKEGNITREIVRHPNGTVSYIDKTTGYGG